MFTRIPPAGKADKLPNLLTVFITALIFLSACAEISGNIKPVDSSEVMERVENELNALGFKCNVVAEVSDQIDCESERSYNTLIKYYDQSKRLHFMAVFSLEKSCEDLGPAIMEYNWNYNVPKATCKDGTIVFLAYTLIPERGISGRDLKTFLEWWAIALNDSLKDSGLHEWMK